MKTLNKNLITKKEVIKRSLFLSQWIDHAPITHYLFEQVQNELKNYRIQQTLMDELNTEEIDNQVKTQFYELLNKEGLS